MAKRLCQNDHESNNNYNYKRRRQIHTIDNTNLFKEDAKRRQQQQIQIRKRKLQENKKYSTPETSSKRICLDIDKRHAYLSLPHGMVNFSLEYIQYLKESYMERSYLGKPEYKCKYCNAIFWFNEQNKKETECNNGIAV